MGLDWKLQETITDGGYDIEVSRAAVFNSALYKATTTYHEVVVVGFGATKIDATVKVLDELASLNLNIPMDC